MVVVDGRGKDSGGWKGGWLLRFGEYKELYIPLSVRSAQKAHETPVMYANLHIIDHPPTHHTLQSSASSDYPEIALRRASRA